MTLVREICSKGRKIKDLLEEVSCGRVRRDRDKTDMRTEEKYVRFSFYTYYTYTYYFFINMIQSFNLNKII